jgi:hypothetical protein
MSPMVLLLLLLCLVLVPVLLRWEQRRFQAIGKGAAWLPARAVPGMAALAAFYVLLLVVAPLVWVGAHWALGAPGAHIPGVRTRGRPARCGGDRCCTAGAMAAAGGVVIAAVGRGGVSPKSLTPYWSSASARPRP